MSDAARAVFLSYASQDAEAAKRICEALRAAGVEVWFDQSELVGGDAWDAKIRKQIGACALFVPLISANTQARLEGYFRLEWKLAAQRTHTMAEEKTFLLPVVIDDTRDAEAKVPSEFKAVQWTRLRSAGLGGQAPDEASVAAFCARINLLLGNGTVGRAAAPEPPHAGTVAPPVKYPWPGRFALVAAVVLFAAFASWRWWRGTSAEGNVADNSVAVLAFKNLSADKANDYFSDGISEEICNLLGRVPGLRVPATASSFTFKGSQVPPAEIARALNVTYLLDGSVQKDGERVRVRARLLNPRDGLPLWISESYDREVRDVLTLQDEIARSIAQHLRMQLRYAFTGSGTVHPEAYQFYLQGRQQLSLGTNRRLAQELFAKAIELDPKFGRAYAGLAESRLASRDWKWRDRAAPELTEIVGLAETAVRLDPNSAETHSARGLAYFSQWENEAAQRELRLALHYNPNWSVAHMFLKGAMSSDGRMAESLQAIRRAAELDPLTPRILFLHSYTLWEAGRYSDSLAEAERALALQPNDRARMIKLKALTSLGRFDEAMPLAQELAKTNRGAQDAAILFELAGMQSEADAILARITETKNMTCLAALGRHEDFLATLDSNNYPLGGVGLLLYAPYLDPIRNDPRFARFLSNLQLTEAHDRAQKWRQSHPPERPWAK